MRGRRRRETPHGAIPTEKRRFPRGDDAPTRRSAICGLFARQGNIRHGWKDDQIRRRTGALEDKPSDEFAGVATTGAIGVNHRGALVIAVATTGRERAGGACFRRMEMFPKSRLKRFHSRCSVLGAMPTLAVGMFSRENRYMATQAWPWHPLYLS
jgi:hypothetical protein